MDYLTLFHVMYLFNLQSYPHTAQVCRLAWTKPYGACAAWGTQNPKGDSHETNWLRVYTT